ncbi:MAG: hypothetical protein IV093_04755 [Rubrivivax sp.]|nr:hypothetical protein [Rubrivivax sp.]
MTALAPLAAWRQFIVCKLVPLPDGRTDKIPCDYRDGRTGIDAHDPQHWTDWQTAEAMAKLWGESFRVGFVLTERDPFFCLDIDGALTPQGTWSTLSHQLLAALPGTACEVSQSGRGLHIWGQGPVPEHSKKNIPLHIELYHERRFFCLGRWWEATGDMTQPCPQIAAVAAAYFPARERSGEPTPGDGPRADWRGPADDDEIVRRALASRSLAKKLGAANDRASFADLWNNNVEVLARAYPANANANSDEPFDRSTADSALASHLAFWVGCDRERMERLMRRSALARDKWDTHSGYLRGNTWSCIDAACAVQVDVLQDPETKSPFDTSAPSAAPGMSQREGATFIGPERAAEIFKGCVYVTDAHRVLVPGGKLLRPEQFNARFGGYTFAMDARNERTSRKAFEAFTENQVLVAPTVDSTCFRPLLEPGAIIETEGRKRVNTWCPPKVDSVAGDVGPFLQHLAKLLPDQRDRDLALYYLANMVQHAGHKFQWAMVLQGTEGNGKSFLSRCVAAALGSDLVTWPDATKLAGRFNAWLFGKMAYLVEDFKVDDDGRLLEKLKPMITGDALEIEAKGVDQRTDEICGNWLFNANARGAMPLTRDTRRYMVLWSAQQTAEDLARDGMHGGYFDALYSWAGRGKGYAHITHYLQSLALPTEYGLSWVQGRAPKTTATSAIVETTRPPAEQAVLDAIEAEHLGFKGGWASSWFLGQLWSSQRPAVKIVGADRDDLMARLGYIRHPALGPSGQVHNIVMPDGRKPQLYLAKAHPALALAKPAEVAAAYSRAQGIGAAPG